MKYVYPAKICAESTGGYTIYFPDVEGAIAQGNTLFDVLNMAENVLCEVLVAYENFKVGRAKEMANQISPPTEDITTGTWIKADTDAYRKKPSSEIEIWYSPNTKKFFTVLSDDDAEVKPTAEKLLREISGVI